MSACHGAAISALSGIREPGPPGSPAAGPQAKRTLELHQRETNVADHARQRDRPPSFPPARRSAALGQGTWHMGEDPRGARAEIAALRLGIDLGMTLIDTAEMYADGARRGTGRRGDRGPARRGVPGQQGAAAPRHRAAGTVAACEASLRRLRHRPARPVPAALARAACRSRRRWTAFGALLRAGKIRHWGVSNFDMADMEELAEIAGGRGGGDRPGALQPDAGAASSGTSCRGAGPAHPDHGLLADRAGPDARRARAQRVAARHRATPAQVALAWVHAAGPGHGHSEGRHA